MEEESPGSSKSTLTKEQRERIERNRLEAKKRLLEKSGAVQEVLAAYKIQDHLAAQAGQPTLKKQKTGFEQPMENDLQNAVSTGTIVRIQGTKLIDTGGGFLLEEKDTVIPEQEEINVVREPAAVAPTDMPKCLECKIDFSESFLYKHFDYKVCDACKDTEEKHSYITRTDAKNDYLLKDVDLDKREPLLKFLLRPNPHNSRWGDMKLYLRLQIEERALEVWGSFDKIEQQHELRDDNRAKAKVKKFSKKMKNSRVGARSSLYTRDLSSHEHSWGPETSTSDLENITSVRGVQTFQLPVISHHLQWSCVC